VPPFAWLAGVVCNTTLHPTPATNGTAVRSVPIRVSRHSSLDNTGVSCTSCNLASRFRNLLIYPYKMGRSSTFVTVIASASRSSTASLSRTQTMTGSSFRSARRQRRVFLPRLASLSLLRAYFREVHQVRSVRALRYRPLVLDRRVRTQRRRSHCKQPSLLAKYRRLR